MWTEKLESKAMDAWKNKSKRADGREGAAGRGRLLRSCLAALRTPFVLLLSPPSTAPSPPACARIDRFYFTAPLFSFNSYPGLIAFCRRRPSPPLPPLRCTLMGIHLRSAIDVTAPQRQRRGGDGSGCHVRDIRKGSVKTEPMRRKVARMVRICSSNLLNSTGCKDFY